MKQPRSRLVLGAALALAAGCARSNHADSSGPGDTGELGQDEAPRTGAEVDPSRSLATGDSPQEVLSPRRRDRRGDEHLLAGRFAEAIEDFDAYLEAEPEADPHHWRRGIAYYYAGRYEEGAAQFVRHRTVNPNDVENAAWHFLCVARSSSLEQARAELLPVGPDQRDPMSTVYELLAGNAAPEDVLAAGLASSQRDSQFFAHLYVGLYMEVAGDATRARTHIDLAATTHGRSHYMGGVARVHAALLEE